MSSLLARLGRFSARHRWGVLITWLLVFSALIGVLLVGGKLSSSEAAPQEMPETAAGRALDRMNEEFPSEGSAHETLQLVFRPTGGDVTADAEAIGDLLAEAAELPGVDAVSNPLSPETPYVSPDREVAVATLDYGEVAERDQQAFYDAALELQEGAPADLGVELGGNLVPLGAPAPGPGEGVGVILALIVLAVTFGSLIAAGVNLLIAVFGVGIGLVGVLAYGALTPIGDNSIILAAMLGLAVGIDYSLFILSRFRNELRAGRPAVEAAGRATGTAGTAVVFAGLTVIVALVALMVAGMRAITEMGVAAAFAVAIAVILSLTMLPAFMGIMGLRALSKKNRSAVRRGEFVGEGGEPKRGILRGWSSVLVKKPITGGLMLLVVVALPVFDMRIAANVPGGSDPESTERAAYNLILDEFGGTQSPLIVLAEGDDVADRVAEIEADLARLDGAQTVAPAEISAAGDMARIVVIPEGGPIDPQTKDLVHSIRAEAYAGIDVEVTGETAIGIDSDQNMMRALVKYIVVIVVISLILMIVLFRSLLIPVIATLGYLLSLAASFGASVAVFQWGWLDVLPAPQGDPMISLLPMILVGVLFGLAMDYQVFLVSRIQEMYHRGMDPKLAIREGFARSGPVLIAAASIMIVVFAGFALAEFAIGAGIAFGLMVGVAADAFIVRMVLMPAVLSLLGRAAWWMPKWLDRILPDIDVEGSALEKSEVMVLAS
jgi:RND superfamily putative drug exporter